MLRIGCVSSRGIHLGWRLPARIRSGGAPINLDVRHPQSARNNSRSSRTTRIVGTRGPCRVRNRANRVLDGHFFVGGAFHKPQSAGRTQCPLTHFSITEIIRSFFPAQITNFFIPGMHSPPDGCICRGTHPPTSVQMLSVHRTICMPGFASFVHGLGKVCTSHGT